MSQSVGVVLPAYDPAVDTLAAYVHALHEAVAPDVVRIELDSPDEATLAGLTDVDATVNAVDSRRGKGAAITAGFEALADDMDVLAFADADGATPAESIADVVAAVREGGADLAVGSRRHPDANVKSHQTFARRYLGDGFAWLARTLLDVSLYDFQCGAKAITTDAWREVRSHLYEPAFAWDVELIAVASAHSLQIVEVPVTWLDQPDSTVSPISTPLELGRCLLRSRHRLKQLRGNSMHEAIADHRTNRIALVDRAYGDVEEQ
jgi:hypothetical protein